jgi:hypothetical protein
MHVIIETKRYNRMIILICISIVSFLQWVTFQLLTQAKLGSSSECFALAQVFVVLLVAPYLAASREQSESRSASSAQLLSLTPISFGKRLLIQLIVSQIPLLCWIFFSTVFAVFVTDTSIGKALKMIVVLGIYCISAGAVAMWGAHVLRDNIFGTALTYFLLCILVSSAFLLKPLGRYIDNLQPIIQPILHLNPLIAVCNIFDGLDIFRNPLLYDRTPITDYVFSYPPWYVCGFWQLVIGGCCFLWTWHRLRSSKFAVIY